MTREEVNKKIDDAENTARWIRIRRNMHHYAMNDGGASLEMFRKYLDWMNATLEPAELEKEFFFRSGLATAGDRGLRPKVVAVTGLDGFPDEMYAWYIDNPDDGIHDRSRVPVKIARHLIPSGKERQLYGTWYRAIAWLGYAAYLQQEKANDDREHRETVSVAAAVDQERSDVSSESQKSEVR